MAITHASDESDSSSIYRAIDCLASVGIEIQLLRRKIHRGDAIPAGDLEDALSRVEPQLDALGAILAELRDQSTT